jgi:hypothetical protein
MPLARVNHSIVGAYDYTEVILLQAVLPRTDFGMLLHIQFVPNTTTQSVTVTNHISFMC